MDEITLAQTFVPLVAAIIFTIFSIKTTQEVISEKANSVLAPVWCILAFICWIAFGLVNLYGTTTDYLAGTAWLYFGISVIFFPVLFFANLLTLLKVSGDMKEQHEMELK